jgi:hypothetical protein
VGRWKKRLGMWARVIWSRCRSLFFFFWLMVFYIFNWCVLFFQFVQGRLLFVLRSNRMVQVQSIRLVSMFTNSCLFYGYASFLCGVYAFYLCCELALMAVYPSLYLEANCPVSTSL